MPPRRRLNRCARWIAAVLVSGLTADAALAQPVAEPTTQPSAEPASEPAAPLPPDEPPPAAPAVPPPGSEAPADEPAPSSSPPAPEPPAPSDAAIPPAARPPTKPSDADESEPDGQPDEPPGESDGDERLLQGGEYRRVGEHNFIMPFHLPTAFANTSLSFSQGFGAYWFEAPQLSVGLDGSGLPIIVEGAPVTHTLLTYGQTFVGQIGILNRVSIDARISGTAGVGGDLDTVFRQGALADVHVSGGPKVRVFTLDDLGLQLSAGLAVGYDRGLQVAPAEIVRNLANVLVATDQILMQTEAATLKPALMLAEGLGFIGAQLAFAPSFAMAGSAPLGEWEPAHELRTGLHVAMDFRELTEDVPLGLTAEYAFSYWLSAAADKDGELDHHLVGGLYYTGRRDLELGGAIYFDALQPSEGPQPLALGAQMVMHYYF